jgi:hypothetical protein
MGCPKTLNIIPRTRLKFFFRQATSKSEDPQQSCLVLVAATKPHGAVFLSCLWSVLVAATKPHGAVFLKINAQKEGVVVLPSGLQYRVIKNAEMPAHVLISA